MSPEPLYPQERYTFEEIQNSCQGDLQSQARIGIQLFNQGDYFEAHEALELAWREEPGPVREVYRGILQIGVAYYHILNGNYRGAVKMFARAKKWLAAYPAICRMVNLDQLRRDALLAEKRLLELGSENLNQFERELLKPIFFKGDIE